MYPLCEVHHEEAWSLSRDLTLNGVDFSIETTPDGQWVLFYIEEGDEPCES